MSQKAQFTWAALIGSTIGGCIPLLWGDSLLSIAGILGNIMGGVIGIAILYKVTSV